MQIIFPMAGKGRRFEEAGYKIPKPLIEVDGKPMIEHVARLFPGEENFIFLCRDEHLQSSNLRETLLALKPKAKIFEIHPEDMGPVPNILKGASVIEDDEPSIVSYCDFNLLWDFPDFKSFLEKRDPDSAAVCYKGFHPHLLGPNLYAGVRTDSDLNALEVREKHSFTENKMETWQQAGLFYFKTGAILKKYSQFVVDKDIRCNGEYYISLLFNPIIQDGLSSVVYPVEYFCQWGTPEDLSQYVAWAAFVKNYLKSNPSGARPPKEYPDELKSKLKDISPQSLNQSFSYWRNYFAQSSK